MEILKKDKKELQNKLNNEINKIQKINKEIATQNYELEKVCAENNILKKITKNFKINLIMK